MERFLWQLELAVCHNRHVDWLCSSTVNSVFPSYRYYHSALIAAGVVLPFEIMMLLPTTVESPRWLFLKGRIPQNGEPDYVKGLKYLRGDGTNARSIIQDLLLKISKPRLKIVIFR